MKYISLNHNSAPTSFRDAVINGLAPDKGLYFPEEEICLSSKLLKSLNNIDDVSSLTDENNSSLEYVADAIIHTKEKLNNEVPLIGFSGSPWTLSTYMIEGAATKEFRKIRSIVFNDADMLNMLIKKLVKSISEYLIMQAKAGANILMIFDY